MDWGFYIYSYINFFYSWMIKLYLVTCFSCDNMTYRLGGAILSCINAIHDSCHSRVIRNQQNLYPIFLLLP